MIKTLILLLPILAFYFFITTNMILSYPKIWPDEAYLADAASNLLNYGEIKTDLWGNILEKAEVEKHLYWYPPVYLITLAIWFKAFGFSIINQRILSIFLGALFIILFYFLMMKELKVKKIITFKFVLIFLSLIALIIDNTFFKAARIGRTDILVLLLGTFSIFLYRAWEINTKNQNYKYALIGLICGITSLVHLIGSVFLMAILIDQMLKNRLLFFKKTKFIYLLAGFTFPLFIWVVSMYPNYYPLLKQLSLQRHFRRIVEPHIISVFRFESLEQKTIYSLYIIITIVNILIAFLKKNRTLILSMVIIGWALYIFGKLEWYTLYFVPFLYFSSLLFIYAKHKILSPLLLILLLSLSIINLKVYLQKQAELINTSSYEQLGNNITSYIPQGKTVYVSTIPDFYFSLKNDYKIYEALVLHPKIDRYIKLLDETDFVVINYHIEHMFVGNVLFRYLELNTKKEYTIAQTGDILPIKIVELTPRDKRAKP